MNNDCTGANQEMHSGTIILGEDDPEVRNYLAMALKCQGYGVELAQDGEEVMRTLEERKSEVSAILLDLIMPRKDGMETLKEIRRTDSVLPVIIVSGVSSPLSVVEAMKQGATDYIPKPVTHEDLCRAVRKALSGSPHAAAAAPPPKDFGLKMQVFQSSSASMHAIYGMLGQVGWSEAPVMIQGETGAGKEVLARELHARSPRASKPFLKLNCAALPSELVESELFGYERGAFTGAFQRKPGMFEMADQGTIFLDEIGDMDYKLQAKLLQVLQDHEFQRLGGKETIRVNVRVIAATHRDLERAIAENSFRQDLYYRLNVITLRLPPLRERTEDIIALGQFLIAKHNVGGAPAPVISPSLRQALLMHSWPGNVRELENIMRRFVILRDADAIAAELRAKASRQLAASLSGRAGGEPEDAPILEQVTRAKHHAEAEAILAALNSTRWNRKKAAALLQIDYKALLYKMKKLAIEDKFISPQKGVRPHGESEGGEPMVFRAGH